LSLPPLKPEPQHPTPSTFRRSRLAVANSKIVIPHPLSRGDRQLSALIGFLSTALSEYFPCRCHLTMPSMTAQPEREAAARAASVA
jgi:hypothetical protein